MKEQLISVFPDIKITSEPPSFRKLSDILEGIRSNDKLRPLIEDIRKEEDKKQRTELKQLLPAIVFAGICTKGVVNKKRKVSFRHDASVTEHTGVVVVDFDDKTSDEIHKIKDYLKTDVHVLSFFISPSGEGNLKALYVFPKDLSIHRARYRALLEDLKRFDPDPTSINIARVCYMSYDPDIYINWGAKPYKKFKIEPEIDEQRLKVEPNIPSDVRTDYNKLALVAKIIRKSKEGYKHITLIKTSYLLGGFIASGQVREDDAVKMMRAEIKARGVDDLKLAYSTIDDGIREGKYKPIYEIEELEESFTHQMSKEEYKDERRGYSFLVDPNKVDEEMYQYIKEGLKDGLTTGYPKWDEHFRLKENNFNMLLGHDNIGKSTVIWFLAVVSSALHGWKWVIYSPENKIFRIKKTLIDYVLGHDARKCPKQKVDKAKDFIDSHFYFIRKDEVYSLYDVLDYGRLLVKDDPLIKAFMIDPYNSLSLDYKGKGAGLNSHEYHVRAISELRIFAESFCTVFVNAHSVTSARRGMFDADGHMKRPQKDDVDQGAIWANRVDDFLTAHRRIKDKENFMWTEIHVDKIKDTETGGWVTSHEEPVMLRLHYGCDFLDEDGYSPMPEWRRDFFETGEQLPLINVDKAF